MKWDKASQATEQRAQKTNVMQPSSKETFFLTQHIRLGLFDMDHDLINRNVQKAKSFREEGGDWDRTNRLKVYRDAYCITTSNFKTAAHFFLDTVVTFIY